MPFVFRSAAFVPGLLVLVVAAGCKQPVPSTQAACPDLPLERTRRLYDFTPVSAANPIVASVDLCAIQIPLSEFRAHLAAEVTAENRPSLTREDKRRHLDRLIDEHLLLMDAYAHKADESPRAANMLRSTRTMLLGEFLVAQEVDAVTKNADDNKRLRKQLLDRALQRAHVTVSNEALADLRAAVQRVTGGKRSHFTDPARAAEGLPADTSSRPLATFKDTTLTVGDALRGYLQMPGTRPSLDRAEGISELLKHVLEQELLAAEALAVGIDRSRPYLEKVELNRSAIARMWFQDRIAARAEQEGSAPDIRDHLQQWYKERLTSRYTYKKENGETSVMPFEGNEQAIRNDYVDALRDRLRDEEAKALRRGRQIVVDEAVMERG